ncbi:hypothetical protein [Bacillus sp. 1006-3]|uniref:hypothetical protein n=1 Tax=Bacillus sp. 1006-3 TaxID=2922309 RepID=UPI001F0E05D9|nr:hypothetical protein [Bacillus sp. 1006-3]MCH4866727.1 hypothetical protein [Bacillus sp. 1006-3]
MLIKKTGNRYYRYSWEQMRSFPIKKDEAEYKLNIGEAELVDSFPSDPAKEDVVESRSVGHEQLQKTNNIVSLDDLRRERENREKLERDKAYFLNSVLPKLSREDVIRLRDAALAGDTELEGELHRLGLAVKLIPESSKK